MRCAVQVDRLSWCQSRPPKGLTASCTTFLLTKKKKIQPLVNRTIEEPSEIESWERFLHEDATGELERVAKDERASLFSAKQSV